jgi:hypothetical protein
MRKILTVIEVGGSLAGLVYALAAGHLPLPHSVGQVLADIQAASLIVAGIVTLAAAGLAVALVRNQRQAPYL